MHILINPRAAESGNETPLFFVSSETKRISFDFRVDYLHNEVEWPIKTGLVIKDLNI